MVAKVVSLVLVTALALPAVAAADTPAPAKPAGPNYFAGSSQPNALVFRGAGKRTHHQRLVIGALLGGAALAGGVGVLFHLDSADAADAVSSDIPTGEAWTPGLQADYDRAERSRVGAIVGYALGGALLVGGLVALGLTTPADTVNEVHIVRARPILAPTAGGAVAGLAVGF